MDTLSRPYSINHLEAVDEEALRHEPYEKADLMERWRHALEAAVHAGRITAPESAVLQRQYDEVFGDYTYLQ